MWQILIEEAGARQDDHESSAFIYHQGRGCTEYRFCGVLGFGGKFWNTSGRWYVTCYIEDQTRERVVAMDRANRRLESLRAGLVDNRIPA